ncbi:MAG: MFS transporter, partial [Acidimicrobiia bacterium]
WGYAGALAGLATADSFPGLLVSSFVMGMAATAMIDAAEVALVDLAGDHLRPYLARANLGGVVGDVAGPLLLAGAIAAGLGWRGALGLAAVLVGLFAVLLSSVPLPPPPPGAAAASSPLRVLTEVAADRRVWRLGLIAALIGPFDEPFLGFLAALAEQARGASTVASVLLTLAAVSGGLLTFTVLERRLRAIQGRRLIVLGGPMMGAGSMAVAVLPYLPATALGALAVGIGLNLAWLGVQHRTLTLNPGRQGTTKAVVSSIEMAGFGLPIAVGAVADRLGLPAAMAAYSLLAAVVVALGRRSDG